MKNQLTKLLPGQKSAHANQGFILPLVLIIGLSMTVGGFALLARSFGGLIGSKKTRTGTPSEGHRRIRNSANNRIFKQ